MWLHFNGMPCFTDVVPIRFGISMVSIPEILIFIPSTGSEHLFHISTAQCENTYSLSKLSWLVKTTNNLRTEAATEVWFAQLERAFQLKFQKPVPFPPRESADSNFHTNLYGARKSHNITALSAPK